MSTTEITSPLYHSYKNGNCDVHLYLDGSKERIYEGEPKPEWPESIDYKCTNKCGQKCAFCHEKSVPTGLHADLAYMQLMLKGLPKGVEIAIGGGNPLEYPHLVSLLYRLYDMGLVANLTVHWAHAERHRSLLYDLCNRRLVNGLGISVDSIFAMDLAPAITNNTVYHVIAGIFKPQNLLKMADRMPKTLVLGYKQFGFGVKYYNEEVDRRLKEWKYWMPTILKKMPHVSFDNLALQQLGIKKLVPDDVWQKHFMGDDGTFTFYIDAVKKEYAKSSTSERLPIGDLTVKEMFQSLQNK